MKLRKTFILILTLVMLSGLFTSVPVLAKEPVSTASVNESTHYIAPRYAYIIRASLSVIPSSSKTNYSLIVSCISDITSISGTLTLYKQNSSGNYEKKSSKNVRCAGNYMNTDSSFSSYGSGKYLLVFEGNVTGSNISEPITISAENSYK